MKNRGKLLSLIIIWNFIGFIFSLLTYFRNPNLLNQFYPSLEWYPYYYLISVILLGGINIGLWYMKKIAIYLLIAHTILTFSIQIYIQYSVNFSEFNDIAILGLIIMAVVWYIAISRKWKYFKT